MKLKVKKMRRIPPPNENYEKFSWRCETCDQVNNDEVRSIVYLGYIKNKIPVELNRRCQSCGERFAITVG